MFRFICVLALLLGSDHWSYKTMTQPSSKELARRVRKHESDKFRRMLQEMGGGIDAGPPPLEAQKELQERIKKALEKAGK